MTQPDLFPRQPTVLALDLATTTGWALHRNGTTTSGVRKLPSDPVRRLQCAENWLAYRLWRVDVVVVERAGYAHQSARAVAAQLLGEVRKAAHLHQITDLRLVSPSTWQKHATGKGRPSKAEVLAAVNERHGLELTRQDEADAVGILAWALDTETP